MRVRTEAAELLDLYAGLEDDDELLKALRYVVSGAVVTPYLNMAVGALLMAQDDQGFNQLKRAEYGLRTAWEAFEPSIPRKENG